MTDGIRIQKALADAGVASRRAADALVAEGRVTVNGVLAVTGQRVDPDADLLAVDGRTVGERRPGVYLVLCKPVGVTSTVSDPHAERTVVSLVPQEQRRAAGRIYPVGRLDRDSEGLLLLTNDGDWAQRVLHPRHELEREYAIGLGRPLTAGEATRLEAGVELDEGVAQLHGLRAASGAEVARLESLMGRSGAPLSWYRAILTQGWRRQLRRMFATVGAPVERLVRVRIGSLRLDDLRPGAVRALTSMERDRLGGSPAAAKPAPARGLIVSLDGPTSSGKSSVGSGAAHQLGYRFCDTGILYRGLAWLAMEEGIDPEDGATLAAVAGDLDPRPDADGRIERLWVGDEEITDLLHTPEVDRAVSAVASVPAVRDALLPMQRRIARDGSVILAGRDIGSVVLPRADLKLYLEVSTAERARRRAGQRGFAWGTAEADAVLADLERRDALDSSRATAPLRVPEGAVIVHGDGRTVDETIAAVVRLIRDAEARRERAPRGRR